jgi:rare lipoprotein A (peptidoglycan hydrolase)
MAKRAMAPSAVVAVGYASPGTSSKTEGYMAHIRLNRLGHILVASLSLALIVALPAHARDVQRRKATASKQVTRASWYGKSFQGKPTASGSVFNPSHLTAAHPTLDLGSKVKVTELRSGRSVIVRITDRGPFLHGRGIDLSYAAARQLGIIRRGVARVRLELLDRGMPAPNAPIVTACSWPMSSWLPQAIAE